MKNKEAWVFTITTVCWATFFAYLGKQVIPHEGIGEIVGLVCGISVGIHTWLVASNALKNLRAK